jgi:hypothetical protein
MNIASQRSNVGTDLRFWYGAPGRIRTRDPLLIRKFESFPPGTGIPPGISGA